MKKTKMNIICMALLLATGVVKADVDTKAFASCASIDGDLSRLECFDSLAKKNKLDGPQSLKLDKTAMGDWYVDKKINPVDDSQTVTMVLESKSGKSKWGRNVGLVLRCSQDTTDMYITWGEYLGSEAKVLTRIGSEKASTEYWSLSTDSKASFKRNPIVLIKQMLGQSKFVAQVTPYNESPVTAIFDISGIDNAVKPLRETCGW